MNRRAALATAFAAALTVAALATAAPRLFKMSSAEAAAPAVATRAVADVVAPGGRKLGTATLTESPRGVLINIQASGLQPGRHGFHVHAKGDCGDPKFERAGGHVHGGGASVHGLLNPSATDSGDLTNLTVAQGGTLDAEVFTGFVTLGQTGGRAPLLDEDGSALVIHANPDDHVTQPIGGAGPRIACAVIKPAR